MKVHVGTSGYAHKEWVGPFYPEKTPSGEMLRFYSGRLNAVEINNTFYHMPTERVLTSWAEQVPDEFVFALKAPQVITHIKRLRNVADETEYLLRTVSTLEGRLGSVLFQFPKSFGADMPVLEAFLELLPHGSLCAFDFRSPTWLDAGVADLLRARGFSLCIEDTDESPQDAIISTTSWGYLRLRRSEYSEADLSQWAERVRSQEWERAFVFFKHEGEAKGPTLAMRFHEIAESS